MLLKREIIIHLCVSADKHVLPETHVLCFTMQRVQYFLYFLFFSHINYEKHYNCTIAKKFDNTLLFRMLCVQ